MPYKIRKQGNRYCVVKESGSSIPGGCHATENEAKEHMSALYANVDDAGNKKSEGKKVKKAAKSHGSTDDGPSPRSIDYRWKVR